MRSMKNHLDKQVLAEYAVVVFCMALTSVTWYRYCKVDPTAAAIPWYSPYFIFYAIVFPVGMSGPLLLCRRIAHRGTPAISQGWLAWTVLGVPYWFIVGGLWISSFDLSDAMLAGISGVAALVVSVLVAFWFLCVCLERLVFKRMLVTSSSPPFWISGMIAYSQLGTILYGFLTAEALM